LRPQRAKEVLLATELSENEVCYEVGYASLGTFTSRFTRLVGCRRDACAG
jgi:AraC-like DNA-binding protein